MSEQAKESRVAPERSLVEHQLQVRALRSYMPFLKNGGIFVPTSREYRPATKSSCCCS